MNPMQPNMVTGQVWAEPAVYHGITDDNFEDFKRLIVDLLNRGKLKKEYIDQLTSEEGMREYIKAFTSNTADPVENYQVYEQLGDLCANQFIVWYMYRRFPQIKCADGVKIGARLRINYGSKQSFYKIATDLEFWPFISASQEERDRKMKPLLEDTLEAFIGATATMLDDKFRNGVGYAIVYDILASIFDKMPISLKYEDLYDAKTRLKELFDMKIYKSQLGELEYIESKIDMMTVSRVFMFKQEVTGFTGTGDNAKLVYRKYNYQELGYGQAPLKADAQQRAAEAAIVNLKRRGFSKPVPEIYTQFCQ